MGDEARNKKDQVIPDKDQELKAEQESGQAFDPDKATKDDWLELLASKEAEIQKMKDKVLRLTAEMENTRKRLQREREEGISFANEQLLREFLPVLDNLERALEHGSKETDVESLLEGVRMTCKSFRDVLEKFGCSAFESVGKTFDPNYHEAMMQEETAEHAENTVVQEYQKGYTLHNRLLRPAMVVVAKSPQENKEKTSASEDRVESED